MKRHGFLLLLVLIPALAAAFGGSCSAIAVASAQDRRNGATYYQQAFDRYAAEFTPEQQDAIAAYLDESASARPPSPELRSLVERAQGVIQLIHQGAQQQYADFDLDRSQGFELMLPHLGQMRSIGRLMKVDAMIRIQDGDPSAAADRIGDLYRVSGHFGDDRIVISSLVGQAVFSMADGVTQALVDRGELNAADSAKLLGAANALGTHDPFAYVNAASGEQELMLNTLTSMEGDEHKFAEFAQSWLGENTPQSTALLAMDSDGLHESIDQYDALMDKVVEAFADPDSAAGKAKIDELMKQVEAGEHGVLASALFPAFGKVMDRKIDAEKKLADRIALLEQLSQGQVSPEEAANAALWYQRGIELLGRHEPAELEAIRAAGVPRANGKDEIPVELPGELTKALASMQDVIDLFREASLKKRCDFRAIRKDDDGLELVPEYVAGMHEGLRLIQLDALRAIRAGDVDAAAERLAVSLRVVGHLGGDVILTSSLASHAAFDQTMAMIGEAFASGTLSDDRKPALLEALDRIGKADPFGYIGAVVETRSQLVNRLRRAGLEAEAFAANETVIKNLSAEQALRVLAMFDGLSRAASANANTPGAPDAAGNQGAPQQQQQPAYPAAAPADEAAKKTGPDELARLADVLSIPDFEAYRRQLPTLAPLLAANDWQGIVEQPAPALCEPSISDRIRQARGTLRGARAILAPPKPDDAAAEDEPADPKAPAKP